jgi:hypothetical protein
MINIKRTARRVWWRFAATPIYTRCYKSLRLALRRPGPRITGTLTDADLNHASLKFNQKDANPTPLCRLMSQYGSDKALGRHNYTTIYDTLFEGRHHSTTAVFEMGIGTTNLNFAANMGADGHPSASLKAWRDFFPNAHIFAADIDRDVLQQAPRITTMYCDQLSKDAIAELWDQPVTKNLLFDVIVDDGLHTYAAGTFFLEHSIHKLKPDGIYIVEDVARRTKEQWLDHLAQRFPASQPLRYAFIELPHPWNNYDNCLVVIKSVSNTKNASKISLHTVKR